MLFHRRTTNNTPSSLKNEFSQELYYVYCLFVKIKLIYSARYGSGDVSPCIAVPIDPELIAEEEYHQTQQTSISQTGFSWSILMFSN